MSEFSDDVFEAAKYWKGPLGKMIGSRFTQDCHSFRIPVMPDRDCATTESIPAEAAFYTFSLNRVRLSMPVNHLRPPTRCNVEAWEVEPEDITNLHRSSIFMASRMPSSESRERMMDHMDSANGDGRRFPMEQERAAAARVIHETEDPVERCRLKSAFFAEMYGMTTASLSGSAQPLTLEGLQRAMGLMRGASPRIFDFREAEQRVLAMINAPLSMRERFEADYRSFHDMQTGRFSGISDAYEHAAFGDPPPATRPCRATSQLRPVEDFLGGCEELITEHRQKWLGDVERLPDAQQGPAPVPRPADEECYHDHSSEERPAPLAPPADFLPARR